MNTLPTTVLAQVHYIHLPDTVINQWKRMKLLLFYLICFDEVVRMKWRSCPPVLSQAHHIHLPDIVIVEWKRVILFLVIKVVSFVFICLDEVVTLLMKLDDDLVLFLHRCITSNCLTLWSINQRGWNCSSWSMNEILNAQVQNKFGQSEGIVSYHQWKKYLMLVQNKLCQLNDWIGPHDQWMKHRELVHGKVSQVGCCFASFRSGWFLEPLVKTSFHPQFLFFIVKLCDWSCQRLHRAILFVNLLRQTGCSIGTNGLPSILLQKW